MHPGFLVDISSVSGEFTRKTKNLVTYTNYEYVRDCDSEQKFNIQKELIIVKKSITYSSKDSRGCETNGYTVGLL